MSQIYNNYKCIINFDVCRGFSGYNSSLPPKLHNLFFNYNTELIRLINIFLQKLVSDIYAVT